MEENSLLLTAAPQNKYVKAPVVKKASSKKFKEVKSRSQSIPLLIPQELKAGETAADILLAKETPNVVFRSKSSSGLKSDNEQQQSTKPVSPTRKSTSSINSATASINQNDEEYKKRILNLKSYKSSTNLQLFAKKSDKVEQHDELFDPSIVFQSSFRCRYYDQNKCIRKGKLLLSANELVFKCAGMPFVKAHLKYGLVEAVKILKRFENIDSRVLCIEYNNSLKKTSTSFYFYHFVMPIKLVKLNLNYLIKKSKKYVNSNDNDTLSIITNENPRQSYESEKAINNLEQKKEMSQLSKKVSDVNIQIPIPHLRTKLKRRESIANNNSPIVAIKRQQQPENTKAIEHDDDLKNKNIANPELGKNTRGIVFLLLSIILLLLANIFKMTEISS